MGHHLWLLCASVDYPIDLSTYRLIFLALCLKSCMLVFLSVCLSVSLYFSRVVPSFVHLLPYLANDLPANLRICRSTFTLTLNPSFQLPYLTMLIYQFSQRAQSTIQLTVSLSTHVFTLPATRLLHHMNKHFIVEIDRISLHAR